MQRRFNKQNGRKQKVANEIGRIYAAGLFNFQFQYVRGILLKIISLVNVRKSDIAAPSFSRLRGQVRAELARSRARDDFVLCKSAHERLCVLNDQLTQAPTGGRINGTNRSYRLEVQR
jgi:hypothetical protein